MSELVESLRGFGEMPYEGSEADPLIGVMHSLAHQAADRIERLERHLDEIANVAASNDDALGVCKYIAREALKDERQSKP